MVAGNVTFPIYNSDGTSFNGLELKKSVYESVVMSLGDKITGDVYYPNNTLVVTMKEYITYNGVKYVLVNPPTIVREGMVSDNGELKGMTKYSFTFYHPMYMLGNFPLCDVAVSSDQQRYLSENKTFFWIGNLTDFVAKLNKNLENTEWYCVINDSVSQADRQRLSEVMSFDKNTIADALKTGYETWDVPYIISIIPSTNPLYQQGKRFLIQYGLPSTEILVENAQHELVPFVFHFGQGVGLKNNSRTPRNNKIVTRIAGYGSEDNIQYGYPQIPYEGGDCQYPLYYGIVGGQRVQLIKHPFTRTHLMPSIYRETVNKKVNPMATGYDPTIELKDYYDADNTYENPIKPLEPSYEIHEFEKIKPELGQRSIVGVSAYSNKDLDSISISSFISLLSEYYTESEYLKEKEELEKIINTIGTMSSNSGSVNTRAYYCDWSFTKDERYAYVKFESSALNFEYTVLMVSPSQDVEWDDTMDDDGNYVQSYFRITIPQLTFDLYASAAITQEMTINMRSGACLGCSFPVMVDWDDYKLNFYDADGNFAPNGSQRDYDKYPDSSQGQITLILQKETSTFGTLMPNIYQKPHVGDEFVILGISLPTSYITSAEARLDAEMKQYMRDNNVYYYDYPLKFDEHFLTTHAGILAQMDNNVIVRFDYAGTEHALYIKQVSVKYENKPLPTYDITLTDNIEVVLNQIGQVVDEVRRLHDNLGGVEVQPSNNYLRKDIDDTAYGMIRLIKGLQVGNRFVTGLLGEGGVFRKEEDGTTYLECDKLYVRMKAYFDTVEVRHYMHSAGNRVASNAGINCSRVEYIDSNGDVTQDATEATLFRCYFRANDDGREVRNDFVVGDLAFCRETNVNTDSVDQHGYWRAVVGRNANGVLTDDGEGWIDLSVSDCQEGSGIPIAQDDIVQLGNKTDTTRQGAIIEFVSGADAPSYQIYQGINTYSLNGKNYIGLGYSSQNARAYLNVYGDAYIGDPNESSYIRYNAGTRNLEIKAKISAQSTIDGETLAQFIAENTWTEEQIDALITAETDPLSDAIEDIRRQVDGNIATWFYDGVPTLQNLPASEWTTADDKNEHLGDLYYDNLTGYAYRFKYDDLNHQWSWMRITDVDVTKALADAAKAQDTADHKRRVFVVQPTPPYDAGDLWVNATYPSGNTETNEAQSKYYNDVLRCKTSKASGTTFAIADWSLASKYTDDQALEDFKANQYVTALTNGTINQNITNALNAANAAQQAADDAQADADAAATAAANAQTSATNANNRLDGWADDGKISPTEKTSLKLEWENVKKEYAQICNDADKYGVSKTAFASAYTSANSAFQKYTAATPENITIGTDYANIAAYYAARQTILDAITTAAKKVATDAQAKADSAYALAGSAEAAAQAAEAHAATLDYVKTALKQDTVIEGGLVLSTLIALRDGSNHIWSGISGTYQSAETGTGYKGHGIAAWYGGAMVDKEVTTTATDYAKSLFRFDGSGYVASGNLSWDKNGDVTIQGYSINATTLQVGGSAVATEAALADYVTLATDQTISGHKTFGTGNGSYIQIGAIRIVYDSTNNALKIVASNGSGSANLYATGGITALGEGSGGSSGGIDMTTVWTALGNATNEQINATHLSNALSAYNPTSNFKTINGNSIIGTGNITVESSGGTVTAVKVGSTSYSPTDGVVSLPAYPTVPTKVSQLTNDSGYITGVSWANVSSKPAATGNATTPVYWNGSGFTNCTDYSNASVKNADTVDNLHASSFYQSGKGFLEGRRTFDTNWNALFTYESAGGAARSFLLNIEAHHNSTVINKTFHITATLRGGVSVREFYSSTFGTNFKIRIGGEDDYWKNTRVDIKRVNGVDGHIRFKVISLDQATITSNEETNVSELAYSYEYTTCNVESAVVEYATKLKTARTIWGQSFDGSADVSGAITGATTITASSNVSVGGTLGVTGAATLSSTLSVSGLLTANGGITIPSGKTLTIGDAVLSWDSTNQGIKITKGLYSQTFISALGQGSSGSSGVDMNTVWTALENNTNEQINASHLSTALLPYATQTWVESQGYTKTSGTVTAVKVGTTTYNPTNGVVSLPQYISEGGDGVVEVGRYLDFHSLEHSEDYTVRLSARPEYTRINVTLPNNDGVLALTTDNVASASKLNTARTLWGQSFDGTGNVSGSLTGVGDISSSSSYYLRDDSSNPFLNLKVGSQNWYVQSMSGGIYIGSTSTKSLKVDASGNVSTVGTLSVTGATTLSSTLSVTGAITATGGVVGNASSATKLQTPRTFWGEPFDGTANVSGALYSVGFIEFDGMSDTANYGGYLDFHYNASTKDYTSRIIEEAEGCLNINSVRVNLGGNVGIGTASPTHKLHVVGTFYASGNSSIGGTFGVTGATTLSSTLGVTSNATIGGTLGVTGATTLSSTLSVSGLLTASGGITIPSGKTLTIGDAVLSWDSTNQGIKITKGLYSQTFISALGQGSSGESGVNMNTVWTALGNNTNEQINASHLSNALLPYATQTWVQQQMSGYTPSSSTRNIIANGVGYTVNSPTTTDINLDNVYLKSATAASTYLSKTDAASTYLPLTGGTMTGQISFPNNSEISGGNGDGASYGTCNLFIKSWFGIGFYNSCTGGDRIDGVSYFINVRYGVSEQKGYCKAQRFASDVSTGTQPYACNSTTLNTNLNADLLDGQHGSYYASASSVPTKVSQLTNDSGYITGVSWANVSSKPAATGNATTPVYWNGSGFTNCTDYSNASVKNADTVDNLHASSFYQSGKGFLEGSRTFNTNWNALFVYSNVGGAARSFLLNIEAHHNSTVINKTFHITATLGGGVSVREFYSSTFGVNFKIRIGGEDSYWKNLRVDIKRVNGVDGHIRFKVISLDQATITSNEETNVSELAYSYEYTTCNVESAVVEYATKLKTARTIWGQSFDGSADVSGAITGATTISASGNVSIGGTLSVTGATTLSSTLGVTGNTTLSGTLSVSKATTLSSTLGVTGAATLSSTLGVTGATTLSSTLVVSGNAKFSGYTGFGYDADTNYRVKVKGVAYASTGVYSGGYVTALSDIRHKDVRGDVNLTVSEVANAPSVKFLWKDRRQEGMQVGSIAQYWKKVMPEAIVENADGELTMSYGVIAMLSAISIARKVQKHDERIKELEGECKRLRAELSMYKHS